MHSAGLGRHRRHRDHSCLQAGEQGRDEIEPGSEQQQGARADRGLIEEMRSDPLRSRVHLRVAQILQGVDAVPREAEGQRIRRVLRSGRHDLTEGYHGRRRQQPTAQRPRDSPRSRHSRQIFSVVVARVW